MKKLMFLSILSLLLVSCSSVPTSKDAYLKAFDEFATDVSRNYKSYTEADWEEQAAKYNQFSEEWYNKFKGELSLKEEVSIKAYQAKWLLCRGVDTAGSKVKDLIDSVDVDGMKKQVQYYIDNDMEDDLQKFYKEAEKAGKESRKAATKVLEDLKVNIDELQREIE